MASPAGGWEYGPTGHTAVDPTTGQFYQYSLTYNALGNITGYTWMPVQALTPVLSSPVVAASTGVNPTETSYALYGHNIPLSVFGVGRIGGEIISGPFIANGLATFCISFGVPADPYGTRTLREIAFDSAVVWENGSFNTEAFTFRFYPGRLDQAADPIEIAHWGADAVAYRPQILLWFENLPIANTKFKKIPYVAAVIADSTGDDVNLGEAFTRLAISPWVQYTSAEFETIGITDGLPSGGLIFAQDAEFLSTIQQFGRFYRNWNILQTDKLRIVDRGAVTTADISLDRTTMAGQIVFARAEQSSLPRVLELSTMDAAADYTIVPSRAVRPREPVNVTSSVSTESVYLPMIMDSSTRQSLVTYTKYQEEIARKKVTGTAMMYGVEIEPGDLVAITGLGSDFEDTTFKIIETLHGANYTVEFTAEAFMDCGHPGDPYFSYVVLLLGFEGADGSTGAPGMTDESPYHSPGLVYGGIQIDTAQAKFGGSSMLVNGVNGSGLQFDYRSSFNLGSSPFTIEAWIRPIAVSGTRFIVGKWGFTASDLSWILYLNGSALTFNVSTTGSDNIVQMTGGTVIVNAWQHVCADFDGSKYRLYINGVMVASSTTLRTIYPTAIELAVGSNSAHLAAPTAFSFNGWLDEVRVSVGIARYASDGGFPVPTNPYPRTGI